MALPVRKKYAIETKTFTFDFSGKLPVGDSFPAQTPTMEIDAGLTAVGSAALDTATGLVSVRISGGTVGQSYFLGARVNTTGGEHLKLGMTIEVTASAN